MKGTKKDRKSEFYFLDFMIKNSSVGPFDRKAMDPLYFKGFIAFLLGVLELNFHDP
jgi:hypothetical protein